MSELLKHRNYSGSAEVSIEDNCLHGSVLFISDVISYEGNTVALLKSEFKKAVDRYCEPKNQRNKEGYKELITIECVQSLIDYINEGSPELGVIKSELGDMILRAKGTYVDRGKES